GEENYLLGQAVIPWDYAGDTWPDLVIGCPGASNGAGKVLIYESSEINIAVKGTVMTASQAILEIEGNNTYFFGSHLEVGDMTGDDIDDLIVLSMKGEQAIPRFEMFSGGVTPGSGYEVELPENSVKNNTRTACLDLYGTGREIFAYSSPDNGEIRIVNIDVTFNPYYFPGANATGVVDFEEGLEESGNTWGWGAGDDGWDTSPTHIYDGSIGYNSVRYNQETGNAGGANRSFGIEKKLFIEIGGVRQTSDERDMSGAYGVSFQLSQENISGISSAVLQFDWEYEDWGFEQQERLWIKARLTNSTGDIVWFGTGMDGYPEPDTTPEIYTRAGQNNGPNLFGTGTYKTDILPLLDGPGEYYLDMGGKISRWTAATEYGGFGFDNLTLTFRTLSHSMKVLTGPVEFGSSMFSIDTDRDGWNDLFIGSPAQGTVSIFRGGQPHWSQLSVIDQDMCNTTIAGTPNTDLGMSAAVLGTSPFNLVPSLAVSAPLEYVGTTSTGRIYIFDLPLQDGEIAIDSGREKNDAPMDFKYYGWRIISLGDHDGDLYPELLVASWTQDDRLRTTLTDRSPSRPMLWILSPGRHEVVSGHINISARVYDIDWDAGAEDVMFYRSNDNRSWNPIGDGTPDKIEGDVAIKFWNTTLFANGGYFLKVSVTDSFGLETSMYTDRVDVLNHAPPFVKLVYPSDGTHLRWVEGISAKVILPSSEELKPPVRFFYSRDNSSWTEYANRSSPIDGSTTDFLAEFDTETLEDGPIWFRVNATTLYGLGSESRNINPALIDNYYPPEGEFIRPYPGSTISGTFNVTIQTYDPDDDVSDPVQLLVSDAQTETWEILGNMTRGQNGTFNFLWDTTLLDNGEYNLMARVTDSMNYQIELDLNDTVTLHNLYEPMIRITSHSEGDTISSLVTFTATITDRDMNLRENDIRFLYRPQGVDIWNSMGRPVLIGNLAQVTWESTLVKNGFIDVRAEVTDLDNLTGMHQISGVRVKNIYPPELDTALLPSFNLPLSGTVRLSFNVSDDEPVPPANIKVEVLVRTTWVDLGNVSRTDPGGIFVTEQWVSYYIDWNTAEKDDSGKMKYPDSMGYDVRITVTDSDGETISYITPVAYHVRNIDDSPDDDDERTGPLLEGWMIAIIVIVVIVLLILILLIFIFRGDKKIKEPVPTVKPPQETAPVGGPAASQEAPSPAGESDESTYSPSGWEPSTPQAPPPEYAPLFTADTDIMDLGLDLDLEAEKEEDLTDLRDELFGIGKKRPKKPIRKRVRHVKAPDIEETVDVVLPEGVAPPSVAAKKAAEEPVEEEWGETEEWGEEEEWEELDEEELEEMDEENPIITCSCGEEVEIPFEFKGSMFRCPRCGKKGKIPGR
ncbi:MAG: hypothetical protein JW939_04030, partial [Candidatus Thermoplasmatota archaeon]|nr:hypothetical protein [Candidatus Thermoplasmatota archaeon]